MLLEGGRKTLNRSTVFGAPVQKNFQNDSIEFEVTLLISFELLPPQLVS